ncbi:MAG: dihydrodipicolinate synthase family protein [Bryobacterales bacterium]|nr:dihydrodipicolinate synthase family protein [Bryobacterales bacterium]
MQTNRRQFLGAAALSAAAAATAEAQRPKPHLEGIFIIMQTPFLETLEIDEDSLRKEADYLVRCGVHGMVWPAGAGETSSISHAERLRYSKSVVEAVKGRTPVLIGVHGANKFEAAEYARHAEKIGADGIHALGQTDGTTDIQILTEYFTAIASASKLPLSIQVSSPAMTPEFLIALAGKLPTFKIAKEEASPVPWNVTKYVERAKGRLIPMTGGGGLNLMNEMQRGSGGTMAGAGFADLQVSIWEWYHQGRKKEARDLFMKFLMMAVLERETGFVLQKEILRRRGIFKTVTMRNTRKFRMDAGDLKELDAIMEIARPYFKV